MHLLFRRARGVWLACGLGSVVFCALLVGLLYGAWPAEARQAKRVRAQLAVDSCDIPARNNNISTTACAPSPNPFNASFLVSNTANDGNDPDWYVISIPADHKLVVTATATLLLQVQIFASTSSPSPSFVGENNLTSVAVYTNSGPSTIEVFVFVTNTSTIKPAFSYTLSWSTQLIQIPTPTPVGGQDDREPNNTPADAWNSSPQKSFINIGAQLVNLNFYPPASAPPGAIRENGDVDWYWFYAPAGRRIRVTTAVQIGVDTELFLFNDSIFSYASPNTNTVNVGLLASNDDYQPLDRSSQIIFTTPYEGRYWIKVWNKDGSPRLPQHTYSLQVAELLESTPTPTVTSTPFPGQPDRFEYNGDFDYATLIAPGVKYDNLNFVPFQPPSRDTVDNDFFRLPVKQGIFYTCETLDLSPGTDTNIIVYDQNRNGIGGNDDISPDERARGNLRSRFSWLSSYTGHAYILVGEVTPPTAERGVERTYSLQCSIGLPPTLTPTPELSTPTPTSIPPTPLPPEPTMTPFPTPRPAQNLSVRSAPTTPPTTGKPIGSAAPRELEINVLLFVDRNGNNDFDPASGEGLQRVSVRLFDDVTGLPLGQSFTDNDGRVRVVLQSNNPVRVSIPILGVSTVVTESPGLVRVMLTTRAPALRRLP